MATFIDFSWKVDEDRRRRAAAVKKAGIEHMDNTIAADEREREHADAAQRDSLSTGNESFAPLPHSAVPPAAGHQPVLRRISWRRRAKEFFRPGLRKKRALEEFELAQGLQAHADEPVGVQSVPGAGLQALRTSRNLSTPALPLSHSYSDVPRGSDDDEITALPPLPGRYNTMLAPRPDPRLSSVQEDDTIHTEGPSLEEFADQAMDEALAAADAPGNRSSIRPELPADWLVGTPLGTPRQLKSVFSDGDLSLAVRDAGFLPLPEAVFSPGTIPLPNFSEFAMAGGRQATARSFRMRNGDEDPDTPVSGRWHGGGHAD